MPNENKNPPGKDAEKTPHVAKYPVYDASGNILDDGRGTKYEYVYDSLGRLIQQTRIRYKTDQFEN